MNAKGLLVFVNNNERSPISPKDNSAYYPQTVLDK